MSDNKAPKTIYLQHYPDDLVTWCEDKINDDDVEYVKSTEVARLALAEQVCYALVAWQELGMAKHRMAVDAALDEWKREAVKDTNIFQNHAEVREYLAQVLSESELKFSKGGEG